jgi:hypothetical protein
MSAAQSPKPTEGRGDITVDPTPPSRRIPHSVFGIGAFLLLLLAALVLVLLSGQLTRHPGAVMFAVFGVPAMIAFTAVVTKRWRRARLGRT